jgi:hypothetical protein
MVRKVGLTLAGLLDRVEDTVRRTAVGRMGVPARAYAADAADAAGTITVFGFPVPADDAGRAALGAILDAELAKRRAIMCVLALESWAVVGRPETDGAGAAAPPPGPLAEYPDRRECILLDGRALGAGAGRGEVRVLEVLRRARLPARGEPGLQRRPRASAHLRPARPHRLLSRGKAMTNRSERAGAVRGGAGAGQSQPRCLNQ